MYQNVPADPQQANSKAPVHTEYQNYPAEKVARQERNFSHSDSRNTDSKQQADYNDDANDEDIYEDGEQIYENCVAKRRQQSDVYENSSSGKMSHAKHEAMIKGSRYSQEATPTKEETSFDVNDLPLPIVEKIYSPDDHSSDCCPSGPIVSLVNARSSVSSLRLSPSEDQPLAMTINEDLAFLDERDSSGSSREFRISEYSALSSGHFATTKTESTQNMPSATNSQPPTGALLAVHNPSRPTSLPQESQNVSQIGAAQCMHDTLPRPRVPRKKQPPPIKSQSVDIVKDEGSKVRGLTTSQSGSNIYTLSHSRKSRSPSPSRKVHESNPQSSELEHLSQQSGAAVTRHNTDFQQRDNAAGMLKGDIAMAHLNEMDVHSKTTPPEPVVPPVPAKRKNRPPQDDVQHKEAFMPHNFEAIKHPQPEPAVRGIPVGTRSPRTDTQRRHLEANEYSGTPQPEPPVRGVLPAEMVAKRGFADARREEPSLPHNHEGSEYPGVAHSEPAVKEVPPVATDRNAPSQTDVPTAIAAQPDNPPDSSRDEELCLLPSQKSSSEPSTEHSNDFHLPVTSQAHPIPCSPATKTTPAPARVDVPSAPVSAPKFEASTSESSETKLDRSGQSRASCSPSSKASVGPTSAPVSSSNFEVSASTTSAADHVMPTSESTQSNFDQSDLDRAGVCRNHEEDESQQQKESLNQPMQRLRSNAMLSSSSSSSKSSKCESRGFEDTTAELEKKYDINLSETWTCSYCINLVPINSRACDVCGRPRFKETLV